VFSARFEPFIQGLRELGYVEGQTIAFAYRFADGKNERLPGLAAELIDLTVDVIVTSGTPAAVAAKQATSMIPIIIATATDSVGEGLVANLARPGGNITGMANLDTELSGKRLEILKDVVPGLSRVAILWNPANPAHRPALGESEVAARALGVQLQPVEVRAPHEFTSAFSARSMSALARSCSSRTRCSAVTAHRSWSRRPRAAYQRCFGSKTLSRLAA
jgi:putative ABC transport system substrate-binding protein